jgi:hypothetical protein
VYVLLFRRACTCLYYYVHVLNHINIYIQCTNLYIECCVAHVKCTDGYIHLMQCTDIVEPGTYIDTFAYSFFIPPAGWPVGWDWLLPGATPIQVQAHTSLIGISLRPCHPLYHPLTPRRLATPALGPRAGGRRRPLPAGVAAAAPSGGVARVMAAAASAASASASASAASAASALEPRRRRPAQGLYHLGLRTCT